MRSDFPGPSGKLANSPGRAFKGQIVALPAGSTIVRSVLAWRANPGSIASPETFRSSAVNFSGSATRLSVGAPATENADGYRAAPPTFGRTTSDSATPSTAAPAAPGVDDGQHSETAFIIRAGSGGRAPNGGGTPHSGAARAVSSPKASTASSATRTTPPVYALALRTFERQRNSSPR